MIPTIAKADLDGDLSARPIIAAGVGIAISALFFAGRVVSRLMLVPNSKRWYSAFNKSDYVLLVGMLAAWTVSVLAIYCQSPSFFFAQEFAYGVLIHRSATASVATGLGRHFERLREEDPTLAGPQQFMKVCLLPWTNCTSNHTDHLPGNSGGRMSFLLQHQLYQILLSVPLS